MKILVLYLGTVPIFFIFDILWLGVIARGTYTKYLGEMMRTPINWPVAITFYLLFILGLLLFAVLPALSKNMVWYATFYGALFGFFTYMTYELTNWAILKTWPWQIVPIDILWGTVLGAVVATISFYLGRTIGIS